MGFQSALTGTINTILGSAVVQQLKRNVNEELATKSKEAIESAAATEEKRFAANKYDEMPQSDLREAIEGFRTRTVRKAWRAENRDYRDEYEALGAYVESELESAREAAVKHTTESLTRTSLTQIAQSLKLSKGQRAKLGFPED